MLNQLTKITRLRRNEDKLELLFIVSFSVLSLILLSVALHFIPTIQDPKAYIPDRSDYLRTFILASISSFVVNWSYRSISKKIITVKLFIELLFLYLLALPQVHEKSRTFSEYNLTSKQTFAFGVVYQGVSLVFYLYDEVKLLNELEEAEVKDLEQMNKINEIRSKSTLSNCLQVRRNSNSLKKILYLDTYKGEGLDYQVDEETSLVFPTQDIVTSSDLIEPIKTVSSYGSITSLFMTQSNNQQLRELDAESRLQLKQKLKYQSFSIHLLWIISSSLYEVGLSLILSFPFIYIPDLTNGHTFSPPVVYYYDKLGLFTLEVVLPLACLVSLIYYLLYRSFHNVRWSVFLYCCLSVVFSVSGWYFT